MKKKLWLMVVLLAMVVGGCAQAQKPDESTITLPSENVDEVAVVDFELVDENSFSEETQKALEERKDELGSYLFMENGKAYLAVFAGQYPTGGYSLEVIEIVQDELDLLISVELVEAGPDMMVTQALTYPMAIVELVDFESIDGLQVTVETEAVITGDDETKTPDGFYVSPTDHVAIGETIIVGEIMEFAGDYIHIISGDLVQVFAYDSSQADSFYLGETVELVKGQNVNELKSFIIEDFSVRHTNMGQIIESIIGQVEAVDQDFITIQSEEREIQLKLYEESNLPLGVLVEAHYMTFDGERHSVIGLYPESAKMDMVVQEVVREDNGAMVLYTSEIDGNEVAYHVYTGNALVELNYSQIQVGDIIVVYADEILESYPAQVYANRVVK